MKRLVSLLCAAVLLLGSGSLAMAQGKGGANRGAAGFKASDANGDGKLTKDEYLDHARKLAEKRWEKLDPDKKGYITFDDAQAMKQKRSEAREARRAAKAGHGPAAGAPAAPETPAAPAAPAPAGQ